MFGSLIEGLQWTPEQISKLTIKQIIIYSEYLSKKSKEAKRRQRLEELRSGRNAGIPGRRLM